MSTRDAVVAISFPEAMAAACHALDRESFHFPPLRSETITVTAFSAPRCIMEPRTGRR